MSDATPDPGRQSHDRHWAEARLAVGKLEAETRDDVQRLLAVSGFGLALLFVLTAGVMIVVSAQNLRDDRELVKHTNEVLLTADGARETMLSGGIERRQYALTGDKTYLGNFTQARRATAGELNRLSNLVRDNPEQEARIAALRALITRRSARLDAMMRSLPSAALRRALELDATKSGQDQLGKAIADRFSAIRTAEFDLLAKREHETDAAEFWLSALAAVSVLLALAAVAFGVYLMERHRHAARTRELQLELTHMHRLGLMNQTSSILVHEITQPLSAAVNYARALVRMTEQPGFDIARGREIAEKIEKQIKRGGDIVGRMRNFVQKHESERQPESPASIVHDAVELFGTISAKVKLETKLDADLPEVLVDRVQAQQVLVNLLRNSVEAMQGCERQQLQLSVSARNDRQVEFCVRDNGKGMSEEQMRRLFTPFTSNKGGGMGLGLSICRAIVAAHGGEIWADSAPAAGTAFHFTLPVAPGSKQR